MIGKTARLRHLVHARSRRALIVPLDHTLSMGMVPGLDAPVDLALESFRHGATAAILHRGSARHLLASDRAAELAGEGLIVQLSGTTTLSPAPARQVLLCDVDEALSLGADAVSVQLNLGCDGDHAMLRMVGRVSEQAARRGLPLLVMAYVRDDAGAVSLVPAKVLHAARVAQELGADVVKIPFANVEVVARAATVLRVPVVVAGGPKATERDLYAMASAVVSAGAAGLCVGRNVFQADRPASVLRRLAEIVHGEAPRALRAAHR